MLWAKLYTDILGDPKLMRAARKGAKQLELLPWLIVFAKQCDDNGRLSVNGEAAEAEDIAALLPGVKAARVAEAFASLLACGVLTTDDDGVLRLTAWDHRSGGKPSDKPESVSARVKRHREAKRNAQTVTPCNALHETPCNAQGETPCNDIEQEQEKEREQEGEGEGFAAVAAPALPSGGWAVSRVVDTIPLAVALTAPARPADRPATPPTLFPSGAVHAPAGGADVVPAVSKPAKAKAGKSPPKFPHFPHDTRVALHEFWESKVGKLDMPIFVREMGALFDRPRTPDELAEYVKRIQSALGLCVAVLSHRALEWKDRNSGYEWSAFRPAKFVARSVEWFNHEQQFRRDPSYLNALCDRPSYARSVA